MGGEGEGVGCMIRVRYHLLLCVGVKIGSTTAAVVLADAYAC